MGNKIDKSNASCEDELLRLKELLEAKEETIPLNVEKPPEEVEEAVSSNVEKLPEAEEVVSLSDYLIKIMEAPSSNTEKCEVLKVLVGKVNRKDFVTFLNSEDSQGSAFLVKALTYYIANKEYRNNEHSSDDFLQYITKLIEFGADYRGMLKLKEVYDNTKVRNTNTNEELDEELKCFNLACCKLKENIYKSDELGKGKKHQFKVFIDGVISNDNPLLVAVLRRDAQVFREFLKDVPITKYYNGNNLLHSVVLLPRDRKVESLKFILANVDEKGDIREAVKAKNSEGLTSLQALLFAKLKAGESVIKSFTSHKSGNNNALRCSVILLAEYEANVNDLEFNVNNKEKGTYYSLLKWLKILVLKEYPTLSEPLKRDIVMKIEYIVDGWLPLHAAVFKGDEKKLKNLVQKGCDPSIQDENGNNILHVIASMLGKQRAEYLEIILSTIRNSGDESLLDKLKKAINDKNGRGLTPIQVALHRKIEQIKDNRVKIAGTLNPYMKNYTANFCIGLLQNGADKEQLTLSGTSIHSRKYYDVIKQVKKEMGSEITKDVENKFNGQFNKGRDNPKKWREMTVIGGLMGFAILGTLLGDIETKIILLCVIAVCITCYLVYCKLASFSIFKPSDGFSKIDVPLGVIEECSISKSENDQGRSR